MLPVSPSFRALAWQANSELLRFASAAIMVGGMNLSSGVAVERIKRVKAPYALMVGLCSVLNALHRHHSGVLLQGSRGQWSPQQEGPHR